MAFMAARVPLDDEFKSWFRELKDKYKKRLWKGVDHSKTDYADQPWEKDANAMEEILYREYLSYLTNFNLSL